MNKCILYNVYGILPRTLGKFQFLQNPAQNATLPETHFGGCFD